MKLEFLPDGPDNSGLIRLFLQGTALVICNRTLKTQLRGMAFIFQPHCCFLENILLFSSLLFATAVGLFSLQTVAQTVNCPGFPEWDSTNQVLFCVKGFPGSPIRAYTGKSQRGADIDVFKDFPDLQKYYGTRVTAGPNGTTFIATTLNFGDLNVREVVLTYDSTGHPMHSSLKSSP